MPEPTEQASKPPRTWRPMILWTAGILLALGLIWFVGAVVVPVYRTNRIVEREFVDMLRYYDGLRGSGLEMYEETIEQLGGQDLACQRLSTYLFLPECLAPHKAKAVVLLGMCGRRAVPTLIRALKDERERVREKAPWALGWIGEEAGEAVPDLIHALNDKSADVRGSAAMALGRIQDLRGVEPLVVALSDEDSRVRWSAARALGSVRPTTQSVILALTRTLGDGDGSVQERAAEALGDIGAAAQDAVPALERLLNDEYQPARSAAADALKKIRAEESNP